MVTNGTLRQSSRCAKRRRPGGVRLGQRVVAEHLRDAMGVDGDQADRALARERAEPFDHAPGRQPQARRAAGFDRDQVAVLRLARSRRPGMVSSLPSIFLSTGSSRPPPCGRLRKIPSTRCLGWSMILMTRPRWRMPLSSSVSSTCSSTRSPMPAASPGLRLARGVNADFRRGPVRLLVPFVGSSDEFAVGYRAR